MENNVTGKMKNGYKHKGAFTLSTDVDTLMWKIGGTYWEKSPLQNIENIGSYLQRTRIYKKSVKK